MPNDSSLRRCVPQVTRVVLMWVNNHFSDFEEEDAMSGFLEEFQSCLEKEVRSVRAHNHMHTHTHTHTQTCTHTYIKSTRVVYVK